MFFKYGTILLANSRYILKANLRILRWIFRIEVIDGDKH
jgi:hypothetical protein